MSLDADSWVNHSQTLALNHHHPRAFLYEFWALEPRNEVPMYQDENDEFSSRFQPLVPARVHQVTPTGRWENPYLPGTKKGWHVPLFCVSLYKGVDALKKLFEHFLWGNFIEHHDNASKMECSSVVEVKDMFSSCEQSGWLFRSWCPNFWYKTRRWTYNSSINRTYIYIYIYIGPKCSMYGFAYIRWKMATFQEKCR